MQATTAKAKLSDAPGCIGSPILRDADHPLCRTCQFRTVCKKLADLNAERLARELGIEKINPKSTGKFLLEGAKGKTVAELESPRFKGSKPLTERGQSVVRGLEGSGLTSERLLEILAMTDRAHVRHALHLAKPKSVAPLLLMIWDNDGKVKRADLSKTLEMDEGYARMTAQSEASTIVNALTNMGVLKEVGTNVMVNT